MRLPRTSHGAQRAEKCSLRLRAASRIKSDTVTLARRRVAPFVWRGAHIEPLGPCGGSAVPGCRHHRSRIVAWRRAERSDPARPGSLPSGPSGAVRPRDPARLVGRATPQALSAQPPACVPKTVRFGTRAVTTAALLVTRIRQAPNRPRTPPNEPDFIASSGMLSNAQAATHDRQRRMHCKCTPRRTESVGPQQSRDSVLDSGGARANASVRSYRCRSHRARCRRPTCRRAAPWLWKDEVAALSAARRACGMKSGSDPVDMASWLSLVERGDRVQGLAFSQGDGPDAPGCGASRIDPPCKKAALEERFGPFQSEVAVSAQREHRAMRVNRRSDGEAPQCGPRSDEREARRHGEALERQRFEDGEISKERSRGKVRKRFYHDLRTGPIGRRVKPDVSPIMLNYGPTARSVVTDSLRKHIGRSLNAHQARFCPRTDALCALPNSD
jgi:hypothetical protein